MLAGDGAAGEGPAWDPKLGVLTSGAKGIHQLTPEGEKKVWREKAGTNGLLFDRDGKLVCCEPVSRSVSRIDRDGKRTVLTDSFGGKKYNQPNDLTIDSKNRIYFSDPRYGDRDDMQQRDDKGKTIEGVYRIDTDGKVTRVIGREVERANGVLVSADDKYLFVADNNNDTGGARKLWRFDLKADGTVDPKEPEAALRLGQGPRAGRAEARREGPAVRRGGLNKPNPPAEPDDEGEGRHLRHRPGEREVARVRRRADRRGDQLRLRRRRPEDACTSPAAARSTASGRRPRARWCGQRNSRAHLIRCSEVSLS